MSSNSNTPSHQTNLGGHSNAYYIHLQQMQQQLASQHQGSNQNQMRSGVTSASQNLLQGPGGGPGKRNIGGTGMVGSTSPHKVIQPHQKRDHGATIQQPQVLQNAVQTSQQQIHLNQQKLIAKRAAAKLVRRKINESQQTSKSMISQHNLTSGGAANVTNSEANPNNGTGVSSTSPHMTNPISNKINNYMGLLGSSQGASQLHNNSTSNSNLQKIGSSQQFNRGQHGPQQQTPHHVTVKQLQIQHTQPGISLSPPSHSIQSNYSQMKKQPESLGAQINVIVPKKNLQAQAINKSKSPPVNPTRIGLQDILNPKQQSVQSSTKLPPFSRPVTGQPSKMAPPQQYQQQQQQQPPPQSSPIVPFQKIAAPPLQQQRRGQPPNNFVTAVNSQQTNNGYNQVRNLDNGEQKLNKKQQMLIPQQSHDKQNLTRSLIEDGSEDFTNIEEHLMEDTRISCRQAVASSLQNVSQMIRQNAYGFGENNTQYKNNSSHNNIRGRRATTHSNISIANKVGEDTFESSSFFDEGLPLQQQSSNRFLFLLQNSNNSQPPHKCNQVDNYNLPPTIFNTLMFGIDQNKVSSHVRESFSKINGGNNKQIHTQSSTKSPGKEEEKVVAQQSTSNRKKSGQRQENNEYYAKNNQSAEKQNSQSNGINQFVTKVDKVQNFVLPQMKPEEEQNDDQDQQQNPQSSDQAALSTIEDFQSSELHRNHLIQTLQSLQYIKTLPPVNKNDVKQRTVKLPPFLDSQIKKTIIFDLDETLVHCIDDIEKNPCDQEISVTFPNGETVKAGINIRPYAIECLKKANESYQVVVFTASHRAYADVVLDILDPTNQLIQYRLYRDHCIRTEEGIYVKDLRIISNRNLKDLIIVDNAVYSFGYQLDNGIPIIPFYDDKTDEELMHLIFYFNCLAQCEDVREQNRKAFQLKDLQEIDIAEYLHSMMNNKNGALQSPNEDDEQTSGSGVIQKDNE